MGDRVLVTVKIKSEDRVRFEAIMKEHGLSPFGVDTFYRFVDYEFADVDCGVLTIEEALQQAKIEYDKRHSDGVIVKKTEEYCRVVDGKVNVTTLTVDSMVGMVSVSDVEDAIKQGTLMEFLAVARSRTTPRNLGG